MSLLAVDMQVSLSRPINNLGYCSSVPTVQERASLGAQFKKFKKRIAGKMRSDKW